MEMKHSWLLEEGSWRAEGLYINKRGEEFPLKGQWHICHERPVWNISGYMEVLTKPPIEYENIYEVEPLLAGQDHTQWFSNNPVLGEMLGSFIIVKDAILSIYTARTAGFTGTEHLKRISGNVYHNRGALMKGREKVLSWSYDLVR